MKKFQGLSADEIKALKDKHGYVEQYDVPLDDQIEGGEVASFILIKPSRNVIMAMAKHAQDKNLEKANDVLIKNCVVAGDKDSLDSEKGNTEVYLSVLERLGKLTEVKKGVVKKL